MPSVVNKKAVLTAAGEIRLVEESVREIPPGHVLVEVAYCGICGSDIPRFFDGKVHGFPIVLGHEFSGTIVAMGSGVTKVALGDPVVGIPLVPCMECSECQAGRYQLCSDYSFIGSREDGAMQKYLVVRDTNVQLLPKGTDLACAALIEPLTVAVHAVHMIEERLAKNARIGIFGFGVVGACLAAYLRDRGWANITAIGRSCDGAKQASAIAFGAESYISSVSEAFSVSRFDCMFDCTSVSTAMRSILPVMASRGVVSVIGSKVSPVEVSATAFNWIQRRELSLVGAWMSYSGPWPGREWAESADLIARRPELFRKLIRGVFPLECTKEAFKEVLAVGPKVLVRPHG